MASSWRRAWRVAIALSVSVSVVVSVSSAWAQVPVRSFAVLAADAALAVDHGRLYRAANGVWVEIPVAGAQPRDVTVSHGMLWALAAGTGTQSGVALVLRVSSAGDLTLAGTVSLPVGYTPRSLAVAGDTDWLIAGGGSLLRDRNGVVTSVALAGPAAVSVRWMPDEVVAVGRADGSVSTWRWGQSRSVAREHLARLIPGVRGTLVLRTDGAVELGPPWVPPLPGAHPWLPPSGIVPVDAVVLHNEQVVEVAADGRGVLNADGHWQPIGVTPGPPTALLATLAGAWSVLADGRLCALVGTRWVVRVQALPSVGR